MKLLGKVVDGVKAAKRAVVTSFLAGVAVAPVLSHAQTSGSTSTVDFSPLTSQVDFSTTVTAVLAVAAALVLLYVAIKGARIVLRMIRGA